MGLRAVVGLCWPVCVGCRGSGSVLAALGGNDNVGGDVEGCRRCHVSVSNH